VVGVLVLGDTNEFDLALFDGSWTSSSQLSVEDISEK
jgi:hypothetical protein